MTDIEEQSDDLTTAALYGFHQRDDEVAALKAEIERLREGERAADTEIERLRDELAREKQEHDRCTTFHAIAVKERNYERVLALKRDEEIERLRGHVELLLEGDGKARDEIERLREAHEACSWQLRNVLDSRDARDTEIERLRGCIVKMQVAAQISDWETFDTVYREAMGERDE